MRRRRRNEQMRKALMVLGGAVALMAAYSMAPDLLRYIRIKMM